MKVFVVLNEWSFNGDADQDVEVFGNIDDARKFIKDEYDKFVNLHYSSDCRFDTKDYHEDYASVSSHGFWAKNHIAWTLYEKEL